MKKCLLILVLVAFVVPLANADGMRLGLGGFGGLNIPIGMEDQSNGTSFGIHAKLKWTSFLSLEPNVTFAKWGEPDPVDGLDLGIDGSKINSYGIDAVIGSLPRGPGFKPYLFVGGAIYSIKNDDTDYDESKLGWSGGLGFGIGVGPTIDLDIRGRVVVAPQEEGSKKAAMVTGGVTYYFNVGQ
jgi:hypothetical protein